MPRAQVSRRAMAAIALAVTLVAFPLGVAAIHQYPDVPDSNPFHADIDAITDAGVTLGCGGGNYCPKSNVTREQMAAFLNRLGALGVGKTPVVNADKVDGLDSTDLMFQMHKYVNPTVTPTIAAGAVYGLFVTCDSGNIISAGTTEETDQEKLTMYGIEMAGADFQILFVNNSGSEVTLDLTGVAQCTGPAVP